MASKSEISFENLINLENLNIDELYEAVKEYYFDMQMMETEIYWMQQYLKRKVPNVLANIQSCLKLSPAKYGMKMELLFLSEDDFKKFALIKSSRKSLSSMSHRMSSFQTRNSTLLSDGLRSSSGANEEINLIRKNRIVEKVLNECEKEMIQERKDAVILMEDLSTELDETKMSCEELNNAIRDLAKFSKSVDSLMKFLNYICKHGSIQLESLRLKTATMHSDLRKQKKSLKRHEEMSGCLVSVDFELAQIEIEKLDKIDEELQKSCDGLRLDVRDTAIMRVSEQIKVYPLKKKLEKIKIKVKENDREIEMPMKRLARTEMNIERLKTPFNKLSAKVKKFSCPTFSEYIQLNDRFRETEIKLIAAKKQSEFLTNRLKRFQIKYEKQIS